MLSDLCNSRVPDIIFVQEHWQTPSNLDKILCFSDNYIGFGISAMEKDTNMSIIRGRPYGGVTTLVNKTLACSQEVKLVLITERVVLISLGNTIFINVYFPPFSASATEVIENTLDQISGVLQDYPGVSLVFGGDLNANIHSVSVTSVLINTFMQRHSLCTVDSQVNINDRITYCHNSLDAKSYIDFLTVSDDLVNHVSDFHILEHALNLSDHLPIILSFTDTWSKNNMHSRNVPSNVNAGIKGKITSLRWDRADLSRYYAGVFNKLSPLLERTNNTYPELISAHCCYHHYFNNTCDDCLSRREYAISVIDEWYNEIIESLVSIADECVPKLRTDALKYWWSQEANDLKCKAIAAHRAWVNTNKPQQGFIFEERKNTKYRYKLFLKKEKEKYIDSVNDSLLNDLANKDHKSFWKSWKSKLCPKKLHQKS